MPAHSGPTIAFFALLVLAGGMKLVRPDLTSGALRAAGLPHSPILVRGLGTAEVVVGVSGIVLGASVPALLAVALYAGFAWFVIHALRHRLPISSCGCFGAADTPPSINHVVVNLGAVVVLAIAALRPIGPWGSIDELGVGLGIAFVLFTAGTVVILYGILAVLPLVRPRSHESAFSTGSGPPS